MAKVYSYIRFSDAKQAEGASSDRQKAYAERWAADHNLQLDTELTMRDEGLSAYHQKHVRKGALGVFLQAVEDGKVPTGSVLVVEGLDRLSRAEPLAAQGQLASIIHAGISVVTASDGKVYSRERLKANPMDLVYSLLVMIRAHEESDTKSKRVRDAIRRQCKGWQEGTYRGLVRLGNTPRWLEVVGGKWTLIEERAAAIRVAVELFMRGFGASKIASELHERGLAPSGHTPNSGHITRILSNPAIVGEKHIELDGESFVLQGYYPEVLNREAWDSLQEQVLLRGRKNVKGDIPSVLTGFGVTHCGYCGQPMKAQTMLKHRREDGSIPDAQRRLQCVSVNSGGGCTVKGSYSIAPIERAIINYCSDMMNLRSLYTGDETTVPRAQLAKARADLASIETKLERLTTAMLEEDGAIPATFMKRARELEDQKTHAVARVGEAERALNETARANIDGAHEEWGQLAKAVEAMDYDARMRARQLVSDTFERIVVFGKGLPAGTLPRGCSDVVLVARGGTGRIIQVDKTGRWTRNKDYGSMAMVPQPELLRAAPPLLRR